MNHTFPFANHHILIGVKWQPIAEIDRAGQKHEISGICDEYEAHFIRKLTGRDGKIMLGLVGKGLVRKKTLLGAALLSRCHTEEPNFILIQSLTGEDGQPLIWLCVVYEGAPVADRICRNDDAVRNDLTEVMNTYQAASFTYYSNDVEAFSAYGVKTGSFEDLCAEFAESPGGKVARECHPEKVSNVLPTIIFLAVLVVAFGGVGTWYKQKMDDEAAAELAAMAAPVVPPAVMYENAIRTYFDSEKFYPAAQSLEAIDSKIKSIDPFRKGWTLKDIVCEAGACKVSWGREKFGQMADLADAQLFTDVDTGVTVIPYPVQRTLFSPVMNSTGWAALWGDAVFYHRALPQIQLAKDLKAEVTAGVPIKIQKVAAAPVDIELREAAWTIGGRIETFDVVKALPNNFQLSKLTIKFSQNELTYSATGQYFYVARTANKK